MLCRPILFVVLTSLVPGDSPAADARGNYAIWGVGQSSCNQFGHAFATDDTGEHRAYLMGYLTAYNMLAADTYKATGQNRLSESLAWLARYCDEHKMDSFERAISQLLAEHHDKRLRGPPGQTRGWGRPNATPDP